MDKAKGSLLWIEAGYNLFAEEGIDGIQIERLARILAMNKSGFYHYFGDMDGYWVEFIRYHDGNANAFMRELKDVKTIEPEYFELLVRYKDPVMVQMQLSHVADKHSELHKVGATIDQTSSVILVPLWTRYLGVENNPDLALKYFGIVRDMVYTRITYKDFNYPYLMRLITDAKEVMRQLTQDNIQQD